jgi:hypothetical protein
MRAGVRDRTTALLRPSKRQYASRLLLFDGCSSEAEADPHARDGRCSSSASVSPASAKTAAFTGKEASVPKALERWQYTRTVLPAGREARSADEPAQSEP